jgi:membrane protein
MAQQGARKPTEIAPRGWWGVLKRAWKESGEDHLEMLGAAVAFYTFSALVPLLTAFVLTYGLVAEPSSVVQHMNTLTGVMPRESAGIIGDQLQNMTEAGGSKTGFALVLALAIALYGASKGATSVMTALNIAYDTDETRGFVTRTLIAIAMVVGAVLVMLLAILAFSAMALVEKLLPDMGGVGHFLVQALSFALAAATVIGLLAVIYRYGPDRPNSKWRWITAGSILATVVWLLATLGFGFYVSNFGNYNATYGSLGAVIVFLTWLYLSAYIVLLGAEVNAVLEQEIAESPAAADPEPVPAPAPALPAGVTRRESEPASAGSLAARFAAASVAAAILGRKDRRAA